MDAHLALHGRMPRPREFQSARMLTRSTRVVVMALILAMLNVWDLWITIAVYEAGTLIEGNPLARYVLDAHGVFGISLFKTLCVAIAMWGFVCGRKLLLAEVGCFTTTFVYVVVAWMWTCYPASEMLVPS